jgi:hypothetical protein
MPRAAVTWLVRWLRDDFTPPKNETPVIVLIRTLGLGAVTLYLLVRGHMLALLFVPLVAWLVVRTVRAWRT